VIVTSRAGYNTAGFNYDCKIANVSDLYASATNGISATSVQLVQVIPFSSSGEVLNTVFNGSTPMQSQNFTLGPGQSIAVGWSSAVSPGLLPTRILIQATHADANNLGLVQGTCYYFFGTTAAYPREEPMMAGLPF
jgi:hypothetical protein